MSKVKVVLLALAAVQVIALLVIGAGGSEYVSEGAASSDGFRPFKDLSRSKVTEIAIAGEDGDRLVAALADGKWVLADRGGYPVRDDKVADTVKALRKLYAARELTRDPARFADLEVADDKHHLRVTVKGEGGELLDDFFLGERGGADKLVYRRAGETVAWAAMGPSSWDFDAGTGSWIDSQYVDLAKDDVRRLKIEPEDGPVLELVGKETEVAPEKPKETDPGDQKPKEADPKEEKKTEVTWVALVDGKERPCDSSKVSSFVSSISRIYMAEPVGKEALPEHGLESPTARATLTMKDGTVVTLSVGKKRDDENDWFFQASSSPYVVTIRDYTVTDYFQKKVKDLLAEEKKAEEAPKDDGKGDDGK